MVLEVGRVVDNQEALGRTAAARDRAEITLKGRASRPGTLMQYADHENAISERLNRGSIAHG